MLTAIQLHDKRMYKKSIRHTIKKGFTPVRVKGYIDVKPTFEFTPLPATPKTSVLSRIKSAFIRRKV